MAHRIHAMLATLDATGHFRAWRALRKNVHSNTNEIHDHQDKKHHTTKIHQEPPSILDRDAKHHIRKPMLTADDTNRKNAMTLFKKAKKNKTTTTANIKACGAPTNYGLRKTRDTK
jgi:hypothetical protein